MTAHREKPKGSRDECATQPTLFAACELLLQRYVGPNARFDLDAAANASNHKLPVWLGPGSPLGIIDATAADVHWAVHGRYIFVNVPFSIHEKFMPKIVQAADDGAFVVCITGAINGARWNEYLRRADTIVFPYPKPQFLPPPGVTASSSMGTVAVSVFLPPALQIIGLPTIDPCWDWTRAA